jgi:hypothetical protein
MASSHDGDRGEVVRLRVLLPGLYAWAATVLSTVLAPGAPVAARLGAGLAVLGLASGSLLLPSRPSLGRSLSLYLFVGASLGTWVAAGSLLSVDRLDPLRAALGALGWLLFALSWGTPRVASSVPEDDPHALPGAPLPARGSLPRGAVPILVLSLAGAAASLLLAWRVDRPRQALLAHAVAILVAVYLVNTGALLAVRRGRWKPLAPASRRLAYALVPLLAVAVLVLVGLIGLFST